MIGTATEVSTSVFNGGARLAKRLPNNAYSRVISGWREAAVVDYRIGPHALNTVSYASFSY